MTTSLQTRNFETRKYQADAEAAIFRHWETLQRILLVLPTGCGKTIVVARVCEELVRQGQRVLILAQRGELLDQAADKIARATGLGCSVEKAEASCHGEFYRIVVGSVQTLMRKSRLDTFDRDYFDTIIIDEAHHALADSYQRILAHFVDAKVLGVTATPERGDMQDLGTYFQAVAYEYTLPQAIKEGYLCHIKAQTIPLKIDLTGVSQQNGDYQLAGLGSALDPYLRQIAHEIQAHSDGRKFVVFLPLIATSRKMQVFLHECGLNVAEVNGESPDRAEILKAFDRGLFQGLCNSMLLTEGWDCPSVNMIVPLRPTKIAPLYRQIIGRGTRIYPGKEDLLILDFLWLTAKHDLCRPASLIASTPEVADKMTAIAESAGGAVDIHEIETQAEAEVCLDREEALAKRLSEMKNRKRTLVDPLQYAMSIQDVSLADYVPAFGWEAEPPKSAQTKALEKFGLFPDEITAGQAERLLASLTTRRESGLSTPKQIRFLESKGFSHVGTWEFESARRLIDRIAANRWRIPAGLEPATYAPGQRKTA